MTIDVTVACPFGATGVGSRVGVLQGQTSGFRLLHARLRRRSAHVLGVDDNGALQIVP